MSEEIDYAGWVQYFLGDLAAKRVSFPAGSQLACMVELSGKILSASMGHISETGIEKGRSLAKNSYTAYVSSGCFDKLPDGLTGQERMNKLEQACRRLYVGLQSADIRFKGCVHMLSKYDDETKALIIAAHPCKVSNGEYIPIQT